MTSMYYIYGQVVKGLYITAWKRRSIARLLRYFMKSGSLNLTAMSKFWAEAGK